MEIIQVELSAPAKRWATRITDTWRKSAQAIIETGRLLIEAKAALAHGEFLEMAKTKLPFDVRATQRLMRIASDARLSNATHESLLPPNWGTLYELTKLDDDTFDARIEDGTINPGMERKAISTLIKKAKREVRERDLGARQQALPQEKFGVILADPEWKFKAWSEETGMDRAADNHYPTSELCDIAARDVLSIAADDSILYLWGIIPMLPQALSVMRAWGFEYKSAHVWGKDKIGLGYWARENCEILLIGTRGRPPAPAPGTQRNHLIMADRGEHSAKPECFLEMIERHFPSLPKIELNRRGTARPGWKAWGNESVPPHDPDTGEIIDTEIPTPANEGNGRTEEAPAASAAAMPPAASEPSNDSYGIPAFLRRTV